MIIMPSRKVAGAAEQQEQQEKRELTSDEKEIVPPEIMQAEKLRLAGELDGALKIISDYLNDHFENVPALVWVRHSTRIGVAVLLVQLKLIEISLTRTR